MHAARVELEELRIKADWNRSAALMALVANCNRDPKRKSSPYQPSDFNPLHATAAPVRKIKMGDLVRIVCGHERPEEVLAEVHRREAAQSSLNPES